jgi:hypothetical protein
MSYLSIPDVIWSGLIASFLTLTGVFFSNRGNTKRLLLQLKHDADENQRERTAELRRDVYLLAAEELTKANRHLATLTQIDLSKVNAADGLQGFFAAIAKLQLVTEPDTSMLVNNLSAAYNELFLRMMADLTSIQNAKSDIAINESFYEKAQIEIARILSEMAKFTESAQTDQRVFTALQNAFAWNQSQADKYLDARTRAQNKLQEKNIAFYRQILTEMKVIAELQLPVVKAIRQELGLNTDVDALKQQMAEQWTKQENLIESLLVNNK